MIVLLSKLKSQAKLLRSRNLLQKPLQITCPMTVILPFLQILRTVPTSLGVNTPRSSDSDVKRAISRLCSTKPIGPHEIPNFIIKGCCEIFIPFLRYIFNLTLSTGRFLLLWKHTAVIPVFKQSSTALVVNYRRISILNKCSEALYPITFFNFKSKLLRNQQGFLKSKSTATNLITY
jgi:hypothetical protein